MIKNRGNENKMTRVASFRTTSLLAELIQSMNVDGGFEDVTSLFCDMLENLILIRITTGRIVTDAIERLEREEQSRKAELN